MADDTIFLVSRSSSSSSPEPIDPVEDDGKRSRKRRTRTKTGCITCRIRRVKCDETRPECKRCVSTGRKCDGWTDVPMSRRDLVPGQFNDRKSVLLSCHAQPSTTTMTSSVEAMYFDFFLRKTSQSTNSFLNTEFWSRTVLQLSHSEPSIKHAILAISSLHQGWELYGSSVVDVDRNAVVQYGKAMKAAKSLLSRSQASLRPDKTTVQNVLVACILFICFENLMGDYGSAATHLANGLQIIKDYTALLEPVDSSPLFDSEILELMRRYHFQAMTFAQARFPFRQASEWYRKGRPPPLPESFDSLSQVRASLFQTVTWSMSVGEVLHFSRTGIRQHPTKSCEEMAQEAQEERDRTVRDHALWWDLFEQFTEEESARNGTPFKHSMMWTWLALYHQVGYLGLTAGCETSEMAWDQHNDDFELLVHRAEMVMSLEHSRSPLSLEMGVCVPLFIAGQKCRHPGIRRRAIRLMDLGNRKEGIWETVPAARVCERLMNLEETEARKIWAAQGIEDREMLTEKDLPEDSRVQNIFTEVDLPKRYVLITLRFKEREDGRTEIKERIDF